MDIIKQYFDFFFNYVNPIQILFELKLKKYTHRTHMWNLQSIHDPLCVRFRRVAWYGEKITQSGRKTSI